MNWTLLRPWLGTVIRLVLAVVWIWAGWVKLGDPRQFVIAVRAYDATPEWLSKAIGYGLPVLEIAVGLVLLAGVITRLAAIVSAALFTVFFIGLTQAAVRGLDLECGCFSDGGLVAGDTSLVLPIARVLLLLALAAFLIRWPLTRLSVDERFAQHDYVEPPSAKRMRTPEFRKKYEAAVAAKTAHARVRNRYITGSLAAIVALTAFIGIAVQSGRATIEGSTEATNASVKDGVVLGNGQVVVDIFEDFQCPGCLTLEQAISPRLAAGIAANKLTVRYHPVAFLDRASNGNRYSSRAANAAICASDVTTEAFARYHDVLFGKEAGGTNRQPAEGSSGVQDIKLYSDWAKAAGLDATALTNFENCVVGERHKALVAAITEDASRRGIVQTPTVMVDGKKLDSIAPADVLAAIDSAVQAKTGSGLPTATPTPTPTSTSTARPSATPSPSGTTSR